MDGHTDSTGEEKYNIWLSEKRAASVKKYLEDGGVSASRITTKGYGPNKPIADNKTPEGRQKNRRVEVVILD
ncbi:OmpA family protein [Sphingobacterium sp. T2]|uniref:OmpA family protein n=1 Tax=Sphingobacterium sp. T2 TaxID=1590596 RepID=UPI000B0B65E1|nr:OmpA family protein [Sphingobacterium sp. T2]